MSEILIVDVIEYPYSPDIASQVVEIQISQTVANIGGGGGISDGDKGDITVSVGGTVWTIDDGSVTNSKIASGVDAAKIGDGSVSNTEFQTLNGASAPFTTAQQTKLGYIAVTQSVDLDAIETRVNELDASVILKGVWDASAGTFPGGGVAQAGWSYIVSVAGTVGGVAFAVNDRIIAITDNASTTTFASNWFKADYTDQVLSVAGKTGAVSLDANDVSETSTKKWLSDTEETKLGHITVTQPVNLDDLETDSHTHSNKSILDATTASFTTADETKLDGIEAGADVTDATNVAAAGAFMKSTDDTDDITEGATNKFATAAEKTKLGHITVTQAVDLDAIETRVNDLDAAVVLKGTWDASAGTFPGGGVAQAGWSYIVSVAGTVGGVAFAVNDRIIAIVDNASTTTFASNWFKADYTDQVVSFDGSTGALTLGALIAGYTTKDAIVNGDTFGFSDSENSNASKKTSWSNIKAVLKTYFDTLYQPLSSVLSNLASVWTPASASGPASLQLHEDTDNGTNKVTIQAPSTLAADYTLTLPPNDGNADDVLKTDGNGNLEWTPQTGGGGGGMTQVYVDQTPDNGSYGLLAGTVNGSNTIFTVAQGSYISGTLQVYRNGQLQTQGASNDYQETSPASGTFTFVTAPLTGNIITAVYQKEVVDLAGGSLSGALNFKKGTDIASASTTDIANANGNYVVVTGTTTITAFGTAQSGTMREVRFDGILTLTHNATSLILPTGSDILTAAGDAALFVSEGSGNWRCLCYRRFNGTALYPYRVANESSADQTITAATDTIITGSTLSIPNGKLAIGSKVLIRVIATKTAAGTATPIWNVRFGTNGTTADTARLTFTGDAQTAAADTATFEFVLTFNVVGASAVLQGTYRMQHNLATTGFGNKNTNMITSTSGTFNSAVSNSILSISLNSGASAAWTIKQCHSELLID